MLQLGRFLPFIFFIERVPGQTASRLPSHYSRSLKEQKEKESVIKTNPNRATSKGKKEGASPSLLLSRCSPVETRSATAFGRKNKRKNKQASDISRLCFLPAVHSPTLSASASPKGRGSIRAEERRRKRKKKEEEVEEEEGLLYFWYLAKGFQKQCKRRSACTVE